MSFIQDKINKTYSPGYFLAHEECVRETKEASQNSALVKTEANGTKYLPMGTAYPSNDGNAIGIVYEDVDVSTGNMPCSVVTKGIVIEDRLAITGASYASVTIGDFVNPSEEGWYESDGESTPTYTLSTDTKANASKTYYAKTGDTTYEAVTVGNYVSPVEQKWYESDGGTGYVASTDTKANGAKTYYSKTDVRLASAAKSALVALGFTFVSETNVTRPY